MDIPWPKIGDKALSTAHLRGAEDFSTVPRDCVLEEIIFGYIEPTPIHNHHQDSEIVLGSGIPT